MQQNNKVNAILLLSILVIFSQGFVVWQQVNNQDEIRYQLDLVDIKMAMLKAKVDIGSAAAIAVGFQADAHFRYVSEGIIKNTLYHINPKASIFDPHLKQVHKQLKQFQKDTSFPSKFDVIKKNLPKQ